MPASADKIKRYFETYDWKAEHDEKTNTWWTGFRGESHNFEISVHLTEHWLFLAINPFVNAPKDKECAARLHHYLLQLNNAVNMAKLSVDSEGDVILTVELPTENLDYSEFADGLNALSYYADIHYLDVLNMAQDAEYVPKAQMESEEDLTDAVRKKPSWEVN